MTIIPASKDDLLIIQKLAYEIWPISYGEILSKEQLHYMLEKFYSLEALSEQFEKQNHHFLLVKEEDVVLGFASYQNNIENHKTKIHKIYVLPNAQGKGIGFQLINEIQSQAKKAKDDILFLNVNRFNKAQHFYSKIGFKIAYEEDIAIGNGYLMEDFVMEKEIL
jgi:diamine N-acetyltransferase